MSTQITYAHVKDKQDISKHNNIVLLYNHIPKCGGLSLTHMLRSCYANSCDVHQNIFDPRALPLDRDFYHGHGVSGIENFLPADKYHYYITILRHPWSLAKSLIKFFKWLLPFDAYYKQSPEKLLLLQEPNILIEYLGNGQKGLAEENLFQNYAFFGLQEFFSDSITLLSSFINNLKEIPQSSKNVSTKEKWEISSHVKDVFFERNAQDIDLYEQAKKEFLHRFAEFKPIDSGKETVSEKLTPQTQDLKPSNIQGDNIRTVLALKQTISINEDLPDMDAPKARFENWLHILLHSMQDAHEYEQYFHWLMQRITQRLSCLYFAFACAEKGQLPQMPIVARHLFDLCQERDPKGHCRIFNNCRTYIAKTFAHHKLLTKKTDWTADLRRWL